MDRIRFGRSVRALRKRRRWSQQDLAETSRVSRSVAGRIERGELSRVRWADLEAVVLALDGQIGLDFRWRGADLDRLLDANHAATVEALARVYRSAGWRVVVEATFSEYGERGSIDLLAWNPDTGDVAVNEVKASIGDVGNTVIGIDRKARLAPAIAGKLGLTCRAVSRFLVIAEGHTSRRRVAEHAALFETAFPVRGRQAPPLDPPTGRTARLGTVLPLIRPRGGRNQPICTGRERPSAGPTLELSSISAPKGQMVAWRTVESSLAQSVLPAVN